MKALRHFCLSVLVATGLALGAGSAYLALNPDALLNMEGGSGTNQFALVILALPALASILYLVTMVFPGGSRSCLTFDTDNGKVEVRLSAAEHYVRKMATEFPEIKSMSPDLRARRGVLSINLQLGVHAGSSIPELSRRVQRRVREVLEKDLGLGTEPVITVTIKEIAGKPQASAEIEPAEQPETDRAEEDVDR